MTDTQQAAPLTIREGDAAAARYIRQRLAEYNMEKVPLAGTLTVEPLVILLQETDGRVVGGIDGSIITYWKRCRVDIFWIDESYRGRGYGGLLLKRAEEIARQRGCNLLQLDTYSFQAPGFYIKNGYEVFGVIEDCPPGYSHYFLKKRLGL